jgi:hypothetical protein
MSCEQDARSRGATLRGENDEISASAACRASRLTARRGCPHLFAPLIGFIAWILCRLARPEGFEPPTPRSEVWCSDPLSYGRTWSGRPDSNRGPLPPHGSALTILRHAPTLSIIPYRAADASRLLAPDDVGQNHRAARVALHIHHRAEHVQNPIDRQNQPDPLQRQPHRL